MSDPPWFIILKGDGMSFPKKGKFFPSQAGRNESETPRAGLRMGRALRLKLPQRCAGRSDQHTPGIKIAAGWTGANERTAKNWFSGRYGPSGENLIALARNSDEVFNTFLAMAGRPEQLAAEKLEEAENVLSIALLAVRSLKRVES